MQTSRHAILKLVNFLFPQFSWNYLSYYKFLRDSKCKQPYLSVEISYYELSQIYKIF